MQLDTNILLFIIIGIIFILVIIALVISIVNSSKINTFMDYGEEGDLMEGVKEYYDKVDELAATINKSADAVIQARLTSCENDIKLALRKTAVVNFDAFDDITGNMSFSLTILDNYNDGIILTSLYGHSSCNTYVREIRNGMSSVKLIDEEKQSLAKAIRNEKKVENDA